MKYKYPGGTPTLFKFITGRENGGFKETINFLKNAVLQKIEKRASEKIFPK